MSARSPLKKIEEGKKNGSGHEQSSLCQSPNKNGLRKEIWIGTSDL